MGSRVEKNMTKIRFYVRRDKNLYRIYRGKVEVCKAYSKKSAYDRIKKLKLSNKDKDGNKLW